MWHEPENACLVGKTVMLLPRGRAAFQPSDARMRDPSTYCTVEVTSRDIKNCLGGDGSIKSGRIAQVDTENIQRLRAAELPDVLGGS